jgi:hypothetical protein
MEKFPEPLPVPSDIKSLIEQHKREEAEQLDKADEAGRKTGVVFNPVTRTKRRPSSSSVETSSDTSTASVPTTDNTVKEDNNPKPNNVPLRNDDAPKPKPVTQPTPVKKQEPQADKPTGTERKGKKGGN